MRENKEEYNIFRETHSTYLSLDHVKLFQAIFIIYK